jgi:hypothetical protein
MVKCDLCGKEFKDAQGLAGHMRFKHGESSNEGNQETKLPMKTMPVDALIRELELPELTNGTQQVFDAGVVYGMKSILIGVRVAQELSRMGVDQATPIIKMAQEMRQAEGQAAEVAAREAARETAAQVAAYFDQKKPDIATTPDPMAGFLARAMETMWNSIVGRVLGGAPGGQIQLPPGWVDKTQQGGQS